MFTGIVLYATYMIATVVKNYRVITPDNRTYRLAFCLLIIVAISFLSFACDKIDEKITTLFGTIAGYVLGGVKWPAQESSEVSENKDGDS